MATPNYEQIKSFDLVTGQLKEAAIDEFLGEFDESMSREEVIEMATWIADKYRFLGSELGAQWYDLCSELAGYSVDPAELQEQNSEEIRKRAEVATRKAMGGDYRQIFKDWLSNEIMASIRDTGDSNLWRDYSRGLVGGKWCRVPVGDTCAWCMMLASQGAWYLSEESALGKTAGHYHDNCDCKAVYHASPESIEGYTELKKYKSMYYKAENTRIAYENGKTTLPPDLEERITLARLKHEQNFDDGKTDVGWNKYNETMIIMRYQNGLK